MEVDESAAGAAPAESAAPQETPKHAAVLNLTELLTKGLQVTSGSTFSSGPPSKAASLDSPLFTAAQKSDVTEAVKLGKATTEIEQLKATKLHLEHVHCSYVGITFDVVAML